MNIVNNVDDDRKLGLICLRGGERMRGLIIVGHGENWSDEGQGSDDSDDWELHC